MYLVSELLTASTKLCQIFLQISGGTFLNHVSTAIKNFLILLKKEVKKKSMLFKGLIFGFSMYVL